eukprot:EG_transcript_18058
MSVGSRWNKYGSLGKGLTDQQCEEAFGALKAKVADLRPLEERDPLMLDEDDLLLKFLCARKYDVAQSEKMLRDYLQWREAYGANSLLTDVNFPEAFGPDNIDLGFGGYDKEGHPVYVDFPKGKPSLEILKTQTWDEVFRWHNFVMERQRQVLKHWKADSLVVIFDMSGLTMGCYTSTSLLGALKKFSAHDQAMFPEILRQLFCINAPATASGTWKMLSPFLDPVVRDKVHIWGPKEWHTKILKYIDPQGLPERLGGQFASWYPVTPKSSEWQLPPPPPPGLGRGGP